jgi:hypothetical protein
VTQVFLNYRAADEGFGVHLLDRELSDRFGSAQVFFASKSIPLGAEWEKVMLSAVERSDALLAIIGRHWLTACDGNEQRLIDRSDDFVRRELLLAHRLDKKIIPVRLGVPRVTKRQLPKVLSWLPECQDIEVRFRSARADLDQLANKLRTLLPELGEKPRTTTQSGTRTYTNNGPVNNLWQIENSTIRDFHVGSTAHYHQRDDGVDR